jgi:flagellar biosynthesis protein FlhB
VAEDTDDDDSKTEEPTEKRIADALEGGNIPISRDASLFASLAALLIVQTLVLPRVTPALAGALVHFLDDPAGWRLAKDSDALELAGLVIDAMTKFVGPPILLIMSFGLITHFAQNTPRIVTDRIMPDFSRISVRAALGRMFGPRGLTEFAKSCAKLVAVGLAVALVVSSQRGLILEAISADPADLPQRLLSLCIKVTAAVTLCMLTLAAADLTWTRIHWRRDLRMSRYDLKEEIRQAEGDRVMKARFRSLRLSLLRRRMMKSVPKATMVVVNPTHYAVAMRYVRGEGPAPKVLAKGVDAVALRIREIAEQHDIPIVEDKPLARALYDAVQVDSVIPAEFYRAVASIVHMIQDRRNSGGANRQRINA